MQRDFMIGSDDPILVTGAAGFIGPAVVQRLLHHGFHNVRAFARPSSDVTRLKAMASACRDGATIQVLRGNLLSLEDCTAATSDVSVIFHLATSTDKSFANAFMNSVVTTSNLLDSCLQHGDLRRFVNISSFAVYTNTRKPQWRLLDESSPVEEQAGRRRDAYCYAKVKQDDLVMEYASRFGLPYVIVRPGSVYGPGKTAITGRVGIDTFGMFLHRAVRTRFPSPMLITALRLSCSRE